MIVLYVAMAMAGWFTALFAGYVISERDHDAGAVAIGISFALIVAALALLAQ